ncbi:MAG: hypothetical protein GY833_12615 [Aestuariibacter sp.]|nr:hypothetical protein [Aestuariibacter sp.]|tara:strand:+ start:115774 stop:116334 length:561 start_codon:yes stop_codon:yes gene_type:complete
MTTRIAQVLESLTPAAVTTLNEAALAGKRERRMFFKVKFHTTDGEQNIIVEAPSKQLAITNAVLLAKYQMPTIAPLVAASQGDTEVELYSAFTPADVPFIDVADASEQDPKYWIFKSAKTDLAKLARKNNRIPYVMPNIAMTHPLKNQYSLVPAYDVPKYVKEGQVVIGKDGARRRQGFSDEPYGK